MQSATTRRFAHVPLAAIAVAAVALVAGVVSLGVTDNLPWQSEGAVSVQSQAMTNDNSLIKGSRRVSQGDGVIGPGTTADVTRPMIKGEPAHGQGEGIIGPDVSLYVPKVQAGPSMDRADRVSGREAPSDTRGAVVDPGIVIGIGEGYIGPGASTLPSVREVEASNPNDAIDRGYWGMGFTDESTTSSSSVIIDQPVGTER